MARTPATAQKMTMAGLAATYSAAPATGAGNGISFAPAPGRFVHVKNGNAAPSVLTMPLNAAKVAVDGAAPPDPTVTVPATTGDRFIGNFHDAHVGTDGNVYVDFSVATTVTYAVIDP